MVAANYGGVGTAGSFMMRGVNVGGYSQLGGTLLSTPSTIGTLGGRSDYNNQGMNGYLGEVIVFDRSLTARQR